MYVWYTVVCLAWSSNLGMCQHQQVWQYMTEQECKADRPTVGLERDYIFSKCRRKFVCQDFNCTKPKLKG